MIGKKYGYFVQDHPYIIPTKEQFIVPLVSEEKIKKIDQPETRIAYGGHVC